MTQREPTSGGTTAHCTECGMVLGHPGEYHPFAFCVWKKAGLDPWTQLQFIAGDLGLDVPPSPPLVSHLEKFKAGSR